MKKLIYKFALLAALLVLMNWIYGKFFFKDDLLKHSDEIKLAWKVAADSCVVVYTGESSNHSHAWYDQDTRKISDFVFDHFPNLKCGDMTKNASHAEVYYYLLENIPEDSPVKTVIVTMNMRSFGYDWIESDLENAIQKQLVLIKDYPPFFNRFRLAFKDYDIKTEQERSKARYYHLCNDKIVFPYPFNYSTSHEWDYAQAHEGVIDSEGNLNNTLTILACHYIKTYGFQIHENNPRVKDFDRIVELAHERGWNLVFNLMAENIDRANELVGKDILFLMRQNRDFLVDRYGNLENVTVVDNLGIVRNGLFLDKNWTTEHYAEKGRKTIANNVALSLKKYHPDMYIEIYKEDNSLVISGEPSDLESNCEKVYISAYALRTTDSSEPSIVMELLKDNNTISHKELSFIDLLEKTNKWDYTTSVLPLDSTFFNADEYRIFINDPKGTLKVKKLDVSFEYDDYARIK